MGMFDFIFGTCFEQVQLDVQLELFVVLFGSPDPLHNAISEIWGCSFIAHHVVEVGTQDPHTASDFKIRKRRSNTEEALIIIRIPAGHRAPCSTLALSSLFTHAGSLGQQPFHLQHSA